MKTINEVCKIVGVTRKTLRGYDEIGLLSPTTRSEDGNRSWLYDDNAVKILIFIQAFIEAGYDRKTVKALIANNNLDLEAEFSKLLESLEEKRKRLDGMINMVKQMKTASSLPEHVLRALGKADYATLYRESSFTARLEESLLERSDDGSNDLDDEEIQLYTPFWYELIAIGCLKNEPINSPDVKNCFASFSKCVWKLVTSDIPEDEVEEELNDMTQEEYGQMLADVCLEMIEDQEIVDLINLNCGDGASEFILKVFTKYRLKKPVQEKVPAGNSDDN